MNHDGNQHEKHDGKHDLQQTISLLARTPPALDALLRDLPEAWTSKTEGQDTWTAFDVVGHLIDGERVNWMPRAKMILERGDSQPFEPFDRIDRKSVV